MTSNLAFLACPSAATDTGDSAQSGPPGRIAESPPDCAADSDAGVLLHGSAHHVAEPSRFRHGALHRAEAADLFGPQHLQELLDGNVWVEPWAGVVVPGRLANAPLTRASAALLRAGPHAVLSGSTAAAMHGCASASASATHVTVPYDRQLRSLPGLFVRQAWIREEDVVELDGLRTHALDVALMELLCAGPQRLALACLEQAFRELGSNALHFRELIGERLARRRDRRGTRQATALLDLAWTDPPESDPVPVDHAEQGGHADVVGSASTGP